MCGRGGGTYGLDAVLEIGLETGLVAEEGVGIETRGLDFGNSKGCETLGVLVTSFKGFDTFPPVLALDNPKP